MAGGGAQQRRHYGGDGQRVEEAFYRLQPVFSRIVKLLELMIVKGEGYVEWANRINQVSKLENQDGVKSPDLQLMKFC